MENVSLKDGDISFSALFLSGIYFTMAHSTAGDALAYSDGASLKGCADTRVIMKHSSQTNHAGQGDLRGGAGIGCGTCTGAQRRPCGTPLIRGCRVCCFCCHVSLNISDYVDFKMFLTSFFFSTCLS